MVIDDKSLEEVSGGESIFDLTSHEPRESVAGRDLKCSKFEPREGANICLWCCHCKHFEQTSIMFGRCKIYQSEDTLSAAELV